MTAKKRPGGGRRGKRGVKGKKARGNGGVVGVQGNEISIRQKERGSASTGSPFYDEIGKNAVSERRRAKHRGGNRFQSLQEFSGFLANQDGAYTEAEALGRCF